MYLAALAITIDDVRAAPLTTKPRFERHADALSRARCLTIAGCEVWLKFENLQFTVLVQGSRPR